jgi:hypothetical protein
MKLATKVVLGTVVVLLISLLVRNELQTRNEITRTLLTRYEKKGYNPPPTITDISRTSVFPARYHVTIVYEHHDYSFEISTDALGEIPLPIKDS